MPTKTNFHRPLRAELTATEQEKVQSALDKVNSVLTRSAATSEPLTPEEWQKLSDADTLLREALSESTMTAAAVFERRGFMAKLSGGLR